MNETVRSRNTTVDKALGILDLISAERLSLTAIEIANHLGASRSTAYRYIDTLVDLGFLQQNPAGGFCLGHKIFELARLGSGTNQTLDLASAWMSQLRAEFNETLTYTRRRNSTHTVIDAVEASQRLVRVGYTVGELMPIHAGAPSVVHLAKDTPDQIRALMREIELTQSTDAMPRSVDDILRSLDLLHTHGYYTSRGEKDAEAVSVAVPLYSPDRSRVLGGLGFIVPANRFNLELEEAMAVRLISASDDIEARLNFYQP